MLDAAASITNDSLSGDTRVSSTQHNKLMEQREPICPLKNPRCRTYSIHNLLTPHWETMC
jgi:hypothetical protein